jgi:microcystin-dependent protein
MARALAEPDSAVSGGKFVQGVVPTHAGLLATIGQRFPFAVAGAGTVDALLTAAATQASAPAIRNSLTGNSVPVALRNPYLGVNFIIALCKVFTQRTVSPRPMRWRGGAAFGAFLPRRIDS